MINLLSDERKDDIRAARANVLILRYMGLIVLAIIFLLGALYTSHSILKVTMTANEEIISSNDVKADVYSSTKQEVDALSAKLNDAKTILDQEIRYSQVLVKIGQLMPAGTVLDNLTLNTASFSGTPVEITAYAKSTAEASTLQTNFQSSSLFTQVNLTGTEEAAGIDGYPTKVSLTVVMNKAGI